MSGNIDCQQCGKRNYYAHWINGVFKIYERLICSECGFLIYDEKNDYLTRKKSVKIYLNN